MTADAFFFVQGSEPLTTFKDLDQVTIKRAVVTDEGDEVPAGMEGTVVDIIKEGLAYAIEFPESFGALATVLAIELRLVEISAA
ncbi:DUF4926 domain-containing protein [uncultured Methylobacterium sp.]|uniref:DUF4926 domain-containing protein n=1 Tax=uncultured Methylobacterium sp. TaxID=157278 RepID=UPI0035CBDF8F